MFDMFEADTFVSVTLPFMPWPDVLESNHARAVHVPAHVHFHMVHALMSEHRLT